VTGNRQLTKTELEEFFQPLHDLVATYWEELSQGDAQLLWALRRKLAKSLTNGKGGTPVHRRRIKALKRTSTLASSRSCDLDLPAKEQTRLAIL
jgi:hypothetical protein